MFVQQKRPELWVFIYDIEIEFIGIIHLLKLGL